MTYKRYLQYLNDLGLSKVSQYDYQDKDVNINLEIERMLNRSIMMYKWHNLPDTVPMRELELILQSQGYAIIGEIGGNLYACYGSLGGVLDEYYRPTKAIVSIPYLSFNAEWEIDKDCIVIKNDTMLQGLVPLYAKYTTLLNEIDITLFMSLVNMRVQAYISASDNNTIESAKEFLDKLKNGDIGVIADNKMFDSVKIQEVSYNQDIYKLREVAQYLRGQLFNEIGLATNYNLKKERITQAEIELNTDNLYPMIDDFYYQRLEGVEKVNDMFGTDWGVEFNSSWDYRIYNGESIDTKEDNPVLDDLEGVQEDIDKEGIDNTLIENQEDLEGVQEDLEGVIDGSIDDNIGSGSGDTVIDSGAFIDNDSIGDSEEPVKGRAEVQDSNDDSGVISDTNDNNIIDNTDNDNTDDNPDDNEELTLNDLAEKVLDILEGGQNKDDKNIGD